MCGVNWQLDFGVCCFSGVVQVVGGGFLVISRYIVFEGMEEDRFIYVEQISRGVVRVVLNMGKVEK